MHADQESYENFMRRQEIMFQTASDKKDRKFKSKKHSKSSADHSTIRIGDETQRMLSAAGGLPGRTSPTPRNQTGMVQKVSK